jgi:serine/threonine-protein kinase
MSEPSSVPNVLGRYELLQPLGQGGMGEVHLARTQGAAGFEKLCIVKTILPQQGKDPQFVERFLHEARVLVQLTHSSIAQVYDMGDASGQLFMSIEYVAGVDLARLEAHAWQHGAQIPVPVALFVGQKIAEALGYAHRKTGADGAPLGIVHRDVSPQNVMISYEGEIKVIDFGLAKSAARSNQTKAATVLGKFGYLSPEQARAERVDYRSDIYSCGIVIWELLAGRMLFELGSPGEMLARMANPKIPSLTELRPDVSEELARAVERALAMNPSDRYARADDFARALNERAIRDGLSISGEDVGSYVRERCANEFADHRSLISRLSSISRPASGALSGELGQTAIRRTPEPAAPVFEATAIRPTPGPAFEATAIRPTPGPSAPAASAPGGYPPGGSAPSGSGPAAIVVAAPVMPAVVAPAAVVSAPVAAMVPAQASAPVPPAAPAAPARRWDVVVGLVVALLLVLVLGVMGGMHFAAKPAAAEGQAVSPVAQAPAPAPQPAPVAEAVPPAPAPTTVVAKATEPADAAEEAVEEVEPASAEPALTKREKRRLRRRRRLAAQTAPAELEVPKEVSVQAPAVAPSAVATAVSLRAYAKKAGFGPWRHVTVFNRSKTTWTRCELRLPDNRHAFIDELEGGDEESINMMKFKQDGPELDQDDTWLRVRCAQGTARVEIH